MTLDRRRTAEDRRQGKAATLADKLAAAAEADRKAREREEALAVLGKARLNAALRPARGQRKTNRRRG
jgi:hypothetical protein